MSNDHWALFPKDSKDLSNAWFYSLRQRDYSNPVYEDGKLISDF